MREQFRQGRVTWANVNEISNPIERAVAKLLLRIHHLLVFWQPKEFSHNHKKTVPDFKIVNTLNPDGRSHYLEVTAGTTDEPRKKRQKNIMAQNGERYTQLGRAELIKMGIDPDNL